MKAKVDFSLVGAAAAMLVLIGSFINFNILTEAQNNPFVITETEGDTIVTEGDDSSDTFEISLADPIPAGVERTYSWADAIIPFGDLIVTPSFLTFDADNFDVPQTVTVSAIDDDFIEGTEVIDINFGLSGESGGGGPAPSTQSVTSAGVIQVTVNDDDEGLVVDSDTSSVGEGESVVLPIVLKPNPSEMPFVISTTDVVVDITSTDNVTVTPNQLTFLSPSNIERTDLTTQSVSSPSQDITVTSIDDDEYMGDTTATLTFAFSGGEGTQYALFEDVDYILDIIEDEPDPATDHNSSRSNKTSSNCSPEEINDGEDNDCDGVVCDVTTGVDEDCDGYPNDGDANNDGIKDIDQDNVVVTRNEKTTVSLRTDSPLRNVSQRALTRELDKSTPALAEAVLAVDDVISFEVDAASSTVELLFYTDEITNADGTTINVADLDSAPVSLKAAKVDDTTGEVTIIDDAVVSVVVIDGQNVIKVEYTVEDGGALDADGLVNGTIVDPVGLLSVDDTDTDTDGLIRTGGLDSMISPVLLTLSGIFMICMVIKYAIYE